jgi:undecaprenyl-diphosphatase
MSDFIVVFFASFLIWFLFFGLFYLWIIDGRIKKEQVLHALMAAVAAWIVTMVIKDIFPSDRPYVVNHERPMTFVTPHDPSFPSGHTALAFALGTSIFLHDKKYGALFFLGSTLVALGRVLANVHYPSDIIAGALIGIMIAWSSAKFHLFGLLKK